MSTETLRAICEMTVRLTELKLREVHHLSIENFAPELFGKLMKESIQTSGEFMEFVPTDNLPPEGERVGRSHERYVYLLWWYREDGPEDLVATLNPNELPVMAETFNTELKPGFTWFESVGKPNLVEELRAMIPSLIAAPQITSLMGGWGGLHVQVVELVNAELTGSEWGRVD